MVFGGNSIDVNLKGFDNMFRLATSSGMSTFAAQDTASVSVMLIAAGITTVMALWMLIDGKLKFALLSASASSLFYYAMFNLMAYRDDATFVQPMFDRSATIEAYQIEHVFRWSNMPSVVFDTPFYLALLLAAAAVLLQLREMYEQNIEWRQELKDGVV